MLAELDNILCNLGDEVPKDDVQKLFAELETALFEKKVARNCLKDQFQLYIIKTRRKINKDKLKKNQFFWNSNLLQFCLYVVKSSSKFFFNMHNVLLNHLTLCINILMKIIKIRVDLVIKFHFHIFRFGIKIIENTSVFFLETLIDIIIINM